MEPKYSESFGVQSYLDYRLPEDRSELGDFSRQEALFYVWGKVFSYAGKNWSHLTGPISNQESIGMRHIHTWLTSSDVALITHSWARNVDIRMEDMTASARHCMDIRIDLISNTRDVIPTRETIENFLDTIVIP